jgi:hypothetical protein
VTLIIRLAPLWGLLAAADVRTGVAE